MHPSYRVDKYRFCVSVDLHVSELKRTDILTCTPYLDSYQLPLPFISSNDRAEYGSIDLFHSLARKAQDFSTSSYFESSTMPRLQPDQLANSRVFSAPV